MRDEDTSCSQHSKNSVYRLIVFSLGIRLKRGNAPEGGSRFKISIAVPKSWTHVRPTLGFVDILVVPTLPNPKIVRSYSKSPTLVSQDTFFFPFCLPYAMGSVRRIPRHFRCSPNIEGKLTKSGTPGWFLNKIGYLFFRDGARLRTPTKRLQIAFWRLNSLRLVYAQHSKPFFRRSNPQNGANDGPQKVLSTDNPILFRNTPGIPRPVL